MATKEQPAGKPGGEIILYQTEDQKTRVQVRLENETVWLTLNEMAELFQRDKSVISKHIKNVFAEGELAREGVVANFATTAADGKSYNVDFYNLDVIISVGYRVKSQRGTQFRIWATQRLREYIVKGFAMDDQRLKQSGGGGYFDELLARIRDIRSSEKVFYRKVLDIYALSMDYDPNTTEARHFFATVQNKIHWAAHGHTAAEIIHGRADATKPNMGLTAFAGARVRREDIGVAKNYLGAKEIDALNRIVSLYLDFAELQASDQKPMYMRDWLAKLDGFLRLSERQILTHYGKVSHDVAEAKAAAEFTKYRVLEDAKPSPVEKQLDEALKKVKQLKPGKGKKTP